uniref:Uncharacterized protein n=2 Tax=Oryza TaxID=4527 RepID=A0A0E0G7E8_ORYNI
MQEKRFYYSGSWWGPPAGSSFLLPLYHLLTVEHLVGTQRDGFGAGAVDGGKVAGRGCGTIPVTGGSGTSRADGGRSKLVGRDGPAVT